MASNGSQIRALVVGGDAADRRTLAQAQKDTSKFELALPEFEFWTEALDRLKKESFQVLLLGREISDADPKKIIDKVKASAPSVPVILFGGPENEDLRRRMIALGAQDVLSSQKLRLEFLQRAILRAAEKTVNPPEEPKADDGELRALAGGPLFDNSFDGIFAYDLKFRIVLWNGVMEKIFGLPQASVLGRPAMEVLPFLTDIDEDEIFVAVKSGKSIAPGGRPFSAPRTGKSGRFEARYSPLKDGDGKIVAILGVFREVSNRVEEQLAEGTERLKLMADVVPALVWMSGRDGRRTFFNKRWRELTGENLDEYVSGEYEKLIHPKDVDLFKNAYGRAVTNRQDFNIEYRIRHRDGQYGRILDTGHALRGSDGHFIGYVGMCADVSEIASQSKKKGHQTLVAHAPNTVENAPIGFWKLDMDLLITKVNPTVTKLLGVTEDNLIGKSFFSIVGGMSATAFNTVMEMGERIHIPNQAITTVKQKTPAFWDIAAWPLKNDQAKIVGVSISTMEVTERQRLLQQKEDFVATLVHDLKTPLIGADKTLETLISGTLGELDSGHNDVLAMLKRSNQQLLMMVQNLIEFYRLDANASVLSFESVDLKEIVLSCASELSALSDSRGVAVVLSLPEKLPSVKGDKVALRRVLTNLLDNALKFTPRGGAVEVSAGVENGRLEVLVKDNGIGISESDQGRLFQRFFQAERGKKFAMGTGLGLYLCREIVTMHKGEITVSSKENGGTTFKVSLPLEKT